MKNIIASFDDFVFENKNEKNNKIEELLKKYDFKKSDVENEFVKDKRYKAIIHKSDKVTISSYTNNYGRLIDSTTYKTIDELEKELEKNHK